jgi:IS5 family transposase
MELSILTLPRPEDAMIVADFADFCLVTYIIVDDLWDALPTECKPRGEQSACSNSELLTMVLVEECMGWDEETEAISQWRQHRDLFPHLPDRTRFNRRRRALTDALLLIRQRVLALLDYAQDRYVVIDSLPVPIIGFHLVPGAASARYWRTQGADYGRVTTKKQTGALWAAFGYKMHLLVTLTGVIRGFSLAAASAHDIAVAPELLGEEWDRVVIGDKGYISAPLARALREERQVTLVTPQRRNQKPPRDPAFTRLLNGMRQVVETVNDQLEEQFRIGTNHAHTFGGLCARLASKLTAHTLCVYINRLLGKADALQIKALAFPN